MSESIDTARDAAAGEPASRVACRVAIGALMLVCAVAFFGRLGAPALFDPDEGRNAEKAREILLLHDWITPHENFTVVLDKPIPYYWLVTASFAAFGVSEWSARLPSALAAAGCVFLVFLFGRRFLGYWAGFWASLVLATSLEFYLLARIVIFDMVLTFFITLALYCFFSALDEPQRHLKRARLRAMYIAMAAATLVKGPIGAVLPGMVILPYLIFSRKLSALRELELPLGMALFFTMVAPGYYLLEKHNPGYLNYFLWEENIARYLTPHFNRRGAWYYFFLVAAVGFFPWTFCIPAIFKRAWSERRQGAVLFSSLWAIVPLIFFSFSSAKLPHYILPIFPPLALLAGLTIDRELAAPASKSAWSLTSSSTVLALFMVAFTVAMGSGSWLPSAARAAIAQLPERLALWTTAAALVFGALVFSAWTGRRRTPAPLFAAFAIGLVIYTDAFSTVLAENSERRSTRELVQRAAAVINPTAQLVIYDTSLESLPFYLRTSRPIWIVWSGAKHSVMGSFYLAEYGAKPAPGYGRALLSFEEFDRAWGQYPSGRLAVFIKKKNLPRLTKNLPHEARILLEYDDLAVVTN